MDDIAKAYTVLELEPGASLEDVNQAYKDLVFIWHPDRIPADNSRLRDKAQDKLKLLNEARSRLKQYLRHGSPKAAVGQPKASKYNPERYGKRRYRSYSAYSQGEHTQPQSSTYTGAANGSSPNAKTAAPPNGHSPFHRQSQPNTQSYSSRPPYKSPEKKSAANGSAPPQPSSPRASSAKPTSSPSPSSNSPSSNSSSSNSSSSNSSSSNSSTAKSSTANSHQNHRPTSPNSSPSSAGQGVSHSPSTSRSQRNNGHSSAYRPYSTVPQPKSDGYADYIYQVPQNTAYRPPQSPAPYRQPDLEGADFKGANLKEKDFSGRNLSKANLEGADLSDAFLHKVNLNQANLHKAKLFRANLLQANLSHANLREANLVGADLSGADLSGADLSGAVVGYGNKVMVKLTAARLTGAIMPDGNIHD
ncbi:pentapeptide repeat-containing protein [Leptothoe kymatousa]|uniref:pentapeptide repeat-containing protein n=1 Tax=Leptothoe kymatousa TaxID=2651727 RepID=UPI001FE9EC40|nr:pentapeptide repeat-containing protein [Leptothoe kymatousa]